MKKSDGGWYSILIVKLSKMDNEVQEARARLAARFSAGTQLGGKGKPLSHSFARTDLIDACRNPTQDQEGRD